MKTILSTLVLFIILSSSATAQKNEEIKVWGNCGMCKKVIETAAKVVEKKSTSLPQVYVVKNRR